MKPNFALNLSLDGIDLFHRSKAGWSHVGTVQLDDPDIGASLGMLRSTAVQLESGGMTTKIIIPDSQILYTEVEAEGADDVAREAAIRKALDGRTPYPVDDLVFDWRAKGRKVQLAVLARETLAEAETFAREHRFNPVAFAAAPVAGRFGGTEPFFGPAPSAAEMLKSLGAPEADDVPLDLEHLRRAGSRPAEPAEAAVPTPPPAALEEAAPPAFTSRRRDPSRAEAPAAPPPQAEPPAPAPAPAVTVEPEPERPTPRLVVSTDEPPAPKVPRLAARREPEPPARPAVSRMPPPDAPAAVRAFSRKAEATAARRAPVIDLGNLRALKGNSAAAPALDLPPEPELDEVPPAPRKETAFGARNEETSRRSPVVIVVLTLALLIALAAIALWSTFWPAGDETPVVSGELVPVPSALGDGPSVLPVLPGPEAAAPEAEAEAEPPLPEDPAAAALDERAALVSPAPLPEAVPEPDPQPEPEVAAAPDPEPPVPGPALPDDPAAAALGEVVGRSELPADLAAAPPGAQPAPEAVLPDASEAAAEVAFAAPVEEPEADAGIDPEAIADGEPDVALDPVPDTPALPDDPVTELVATDEGAAERVREQLLGELTPEVAERRYAATGVWVMSPEPPADPAEERTDDIYVAAIDTDIAGQDAVALPQPAPDRSILSPLPPPAAGTTFDFDERGLVRATPEGAVNPDGILVYLGRPPLAPAPRPGSGEAAAPAGGEAEADNAAPDADNPLSGFRPRPRPTDLSETNEKAQLGGRTRAQLATLRPRERPSTIVAIAATPPDAPETAELAPATDLAVAASRMPRTRPAEIVALASAARIAPPPGGGGSERASSGGSQNDVAEADNEPVVEVAAAVAPKIPTKASVAKNATVANAINLSKINLIGVYGSPSQRRALVRMSNGKYVKVKIGDRLDGGRVAAIGEKELVYQKGGRQVRLELPKT